MFLCYRYTNHQSSGWVDFFMGFSWRYASSLSLDLSPMRFLELCSNNAVHGASFEFQDILLLFWVPDLTILRKRRIPRLFRIKLARFEIEPVGFEYGNRTAQDHSRVESPSTLRYTRGRQLEPESRSVNLIVISKDISGFLWLPSTRNAPETTNKAAWPRQPRTIRHPASIPGHISTTGRVLSPVFWI